MALMGGDTVGTLNVRVTADSRDLARQVTAGATAAGSTGAHAFASSFKKVIGPLLGAVAFAKVVKGIGSVVTSASDLGESVNAVKVVFEKFGDTAPAAVGKLAKEAAKTRGLSTKDFNQMAVQFSAFASQVAGDGGDVVGTLDDMTQRVADFASVQNLEVTEAGRIFQSALAGETEAVRRYGIDLSAATVEEYAYATGIAAKGKELTEQEKITARYRLLMEKTSDTAGDFANTSDSLANRQRILAASFENAKAKIGEAFLPIAEKVVGWAQERFIPAMEGAASLITDRLVPGFKGLTDLILRGDFTAEFGKAFNVEEDSPVVRAILKVRDAVDGVVSKIRDDFIPVIKDLLRNEDLQRFAAGVAATVAAFYAYQKVISILTAVRGAVLLLNLALMANPAGIVVAAIAAIVGALVLLYNKNEEVRAFIDEAWARIQEAIGTVVDWAVTYAWPWLKRVWDGIAAGAKNLWENVLRPVFNAIRQAWEGMVSAMSWLWNSILLPAWNAIMSVARFLWETILRPVFQAIKVGWEIAMIAMKNLWDTLLKPAWDRMAAAATWLYEQVLKPAFDNIKRAWEALYPIFKKGVEIISGAWDAIKAAAMRPIGFIVETVLNDGIIAAINWVAEKLGAESRVSRIPWPPRGWGGGQQFGPGGVPAYGGTDNMASGLRGVWDALTDPLGWVRGKLDSLLSGVGDSPLARILADGARSVAQMVADWFTQRLSFGTGERGVAGKVLPAGSYRIGMPFLGYPGHYGADYPANVGTPIYAPYPGVVSSAVSLAGSYGRNVLLTHPGGVQTRYAHMSRYVVQAGQPVGAGQLIGFVGSTGNSTGPHLHFEYLRGGRPVNPASLGIFDKGGWLRSGGMALNLSGSPEMVLSPRESDALRTLQISAPVMAGQAAGGRSTVVTIGVTTESLARDIAEIYRTHEWLSRGA